MTTNRGGHTGRCSSRSFRTILFAAVLSLLAAACVDGDATPADDNADRGQQADQDSGTDTQDGTDDGAGGDTAGDSTDDGPLAVGAVADPDSLASIDMGACPFDERVPLPVQPDCYALSVPESWDTPDANDQVVIQLAVFRGDGSTSDPIIYFDGGPGGHTLDNLAFSFGNLVEPYLSGRDYIVFDQRGLGLSEPVLDCPESTEVAVEELTGVLDVEAAKTATIEALDACHDRLASAGIDLTAYNSVASSNDVEAMRALLGYEQLNVIGTSYGTRLAQSYLRMYPQSIRSVTLDSVFPTEYDLWSNFNPGAERAFEQFFTGCAESAECAAAYPDLRGRFFEFLDELDENPAEVEVRNLLDNSTLDVQFDGDDVMGLVFSALYDRGRFAVVPQMVEDGLEGDYSAIELFGSILITNLNFVSQGMRLSVECNEEIPFETRETLLAYEPSDPSYERLSDLEGAELTLFDLCEVWPAGTAPEVESEGVASDKPVLVLAGQYDPITPPSGADLVAANLSNAYTFLFPHEGHGLVPTECGAEILNAFIDDPSVAPSGACIAEAPEPNWAPSSDVGDIELVAFEVSGLVSVSGLRPDGWLDAGNGAFARQLTALDPTTLVVQPTNGLAGATLADLISSQLGVELVPGDPIDIDGTSWESFSTSAVDSQAARLAVKPGVDGVVVMLVADVAEIDVLYDAIFVPVAAAATPG